MKTRKCFNCGREFELTTIVDGKEVEINSFRDEDGLIIICPFCDCVMGDGASEDCDDGLPF